MKKIALPIFLTLFLTLIAVKYGYPCSGAAYIDSDKTIAWVNFDKPEATRADFENSKGLFGSRTMGVRWVGQKSPAPHISQGVNEHGLAIITMSAPDGTPCASTGDWLREFKTVDEALNKIEGKSSYLGFHQFKILADRQKVALIESYSSKDCKIVVIDKGLLTHTNHYIFSELSQYNDKLAKKPGQIAFSEKRLKIIEDFLGANDKTIESFKELSAIKHLNRDDTIASIIIYVPHNDEKPKVIYRLPKSQDKDWVEVGF
jgi:hypothetical protein